MKNSTDWKSRRGLRSSTSSGVLEDRISDLPDSVIQHILSFLDVKNAVKTCVLSKRWESLWTSIPNLLFYCESNERDEVLRGYASFVDNTLRKCTSTKIKKFLLQCSYYISKKQVDSWLQFAVDHKVEELCLQWPFGYSVAIYKWPEFMYKNSSVTSMSLMLKFDKVLEGFCWTSLKVLLLKDSVLRNETIRCILLGCPVIECLTLQECELYGNDDGDDDWDDLGIIDASSTSLKKLVINGYNTELDHQQVDIVAPNLQSLTIVGYMDGTAFMFVDISCLVEIHLEFSMGFMLNDHEKKMLKNLIQDLSHVNKLSLDIWCIHDHSMRKTIRARFPIATRKILEIDMESVKGYLPGLSTLIWSSPSLEQLTINLMPPGYEEFKPVEYCDDDMDFEPALIVPFPNWHLRNIKITGFAAGFCSSSDKLLVEMVQLLLANAKVLQKLIIYYEADSMTIGKRRTSWKLFEIAQKLLSYPRASIESVVLFESHLQQFQMSTGTRS